MQLKIFSIPIIGGEQVNEEMNHFLRANKIIQVEKEYTVIGGNAFWSFCITYQPEGVVETSGQSQRVDYKEVLDEASFNRFSSMREIRKKIANEEGIPAYAVFTNKELAAMAEMEPLTLAIMKTIKGIGEQRVEKYGKHFITEVEHEKG